MPRTARNAAGGMVFHVINRGVGKNDLFFNDADYLAFERVIRETLEKRPMRVISYCRDEKSLAFRSLAGKRW